LGIGDWGFGPIPNPQSPIPNPQSPIPMYINMKNKNKKDIFFLKIYSNSCLKIKNKIK
jgi:hypothetical protein